MSRFFYPSSRAHHAYSMAIDFGMKFQKRNGLWATESLPHLAGMNCQIDVAEECLHLLEPQVNDVVFTNLKGWVSVEAIQSDLRASEAKHFIKRGGRIIQRNGVAFHWPESEAA